MYRWALGHCAVISASQGMQARDLQPLGLAGARLYVVPNTVDRVDVRRFRSVLRASPRPRLLFLSSTFPFKGIFVLLESLRLLVERGVEFDAEIVGSSTAEFDRAIREFVAAEGLARQVVCLGALYDADKYAALGRADILVHPTLNDYFPLVLLEAMQFGLAIVTTRIGAIPEMVVDGVHGTLVPDGDAKALASAIEALIAVPATVRHMGAAAQCRYQQHFSPERFSAELIGVFEAEALAARIR
jgi:glycosyltransferase involved in cell wall biosynthesis